MPRAVLAIFFATSLLPAVLAAQQPCSPKAAIAQVQLRQSELGKAQVEEMSTDVPPAIRNQINSFKDALASAVQAGIACVAADADAATIQNAFAKMLRANLPEKPFKPSTDQAESNIYGSDLKVNVSTPPNALQLRAVQLTFGIECGSDTMLVLYQATPQGWRRILRWQSQDYSEISGAFSDLFEYAVLPGGTNAFRVVTVHGTAWCTSRFSAFDLDVLAPSGNSEHPQVIWHTRRDYSRGDYPDRLRSVGSDTFEFRTNVPALSPEVYERTVVFRYKIDGNRVIRVQPTALNARGFINEWMSMPWGEAVNQIDPASSASMRALYNGFQHSADGSSSSFVENRNGPVRMCIAKKQFQVEIESTKETIVPGKPGGNSEPLPSTYFRVLETGNGYKLLAAGIKPDPSCTGPDLMQKK